MIHQDCIMKNNVKNTFKTREKYYRDRRARSFVPNGRLS